MHKDIVGGVLRTQHPQRDDDQEKAEDVTDQTTNLELWKEWGSIRVKKDCDEDERKHDQSNLPAREHIVRSRDVDDGLHLNGEDVDTACNTSEPSQGRHPSGSVRQDFLILRRCEFRYLETSELVH